MAYYSKKFEELVFVSIKDEEFADYSLQMLMEKTGYSRYLVQKALTRLVSKGMIEVTRVLGTTNMYRVKKQDETKKG